MITKKLSVSLVALAISFGPVAPSYADGRDFVAGALIGGVVGAAINQNVRNKRTYRRTTKRTTRRTTRRSTIPATTQGREIQTSLNYFGFNAGSVDGQLGKGSRRAISGYQTYLGYPATGHLSPFEQNLLVSSYNRSLAGGAVVNQQVAANPEGTRGLLKVFRAEMAGGNVGGVGTTVVVNQAPVAPIVQPAPIVAAAPALPNFLGATTAVSLASHCNKVSLLTSSNGGFSTAENVTDANFALNEQFCLARTYAIAHGEELTSKVTGVTPQQVAQQCEGFGPAMQEQVAALSFKPLDDVVRDVNNFVLQTGMSPAQLSGTAKICLSVGYRTDNMDVAIGSALLLHSLGEHVYGELLAHHLSQGFGASRRPDLALAWYTTSLDAADRGAVAAFAPGQPERTTLIRKAAFDVSGAQSGANSTATPTVIPAFAVSQ